MGELVISGVPAAVKREVQNKWRLKAGDTYDASYVGTFIKEDLPRIVAGPRLVNAPVKFKVIPNSVNGTVQVEIELP